MQAIATLLVMCDARDLGVSVGENQATNESPIAANAEHAPLSSGGGGAGGEGGARSITGLAPQVVAFEPNIYLYDKYPGGVGLSEPLYRLSESLLENTRKLIERCPCIAGCPSCVGPVGEVGEKGKEVALAILRCILGRE